MYKLDTSELKDGDTNELQQWVEDYPLKKAKAALKIFNDDYIKNQEKIANSKSPDIELETDCIALQHDIFMIEEVIKFHEKNGGVLAFDCNM